MTNEHNFCEYCLRADSNSDVVSRCYNCSENPKPVPIEEKGGNEHVKDGKA